MRLLCNAPEHPCVRRVPLLPLTHGAQRPLSQMLSCNVSNRGIREQTLRRLWFYTGFSSVPRRVQALPSWTVAAGEPERSRPSPSPGWPWVVPQVLALAQDFPKHPPYPAKRAGTERKPDKQEEVRLLKNCDRMSGSELCENMLPHAATTCLLRMHSVPTLMTYWT